MDNIDVKASTEYAYWIISTWFYPTPLTCYSFMYPLLWNYQEIDNHYKVHKYCSTTTLKALTTEVNKTTTILSQCNSLLGNSGSCQACGCYLTFTFHLNITADWTHLPLPEAKTPFKNGSKNLTKSPRLRPDLQTPEIPIPSASPYKTQRIQRNGSLYGLHTATGLD